MELRGSSLDESKQASGPRTFNFLNSDKSQKRKSKRYSLEKKNNTIDNLVLIRKSGNSARYIHWVEIFKRATVAFDGRISRRGSQGGRDGGARGGRGETTSISSGRSSIIGPRVDP